MVQLNGAARTERVALRLHKSRLREDGVAQRQRPARGWLHRWGGGHQSGGALHTGCHQTVPSFSQHLGLDLIISPNTRHRQGGSGPWLWQDTPQA